MNIIKIITTALEKIANKQNSLTADGTNTKYPTVTAVNSGLATKQATLVSGTNIKTINSQSLLGAGDIAISSGITVGTTPVTSGTVGRVFFQGAGDVVQQNSSLTWENTLSTLKILAGSGSPFLFRNNPDTADILNISNAGQVKSVGNSNLHGFVTKALTDQNSFIGYSVETSGNVERSQFKCNINNGEIRIGSGGAGTGSTNYFPTIYSGGVEVARFSTQGRFGIGVTSITGLIHLKAGTATAGTAPIKLTAGVNLTTPENGTLEFDGTNLYFTVGGIRKTVNLI